MLQHAKKCQIQFMALVPLCKLALPNSRHFSTIISLTSPLRVCVCVYMLILLPSLSIAHNTQELISPLKSNQISLHGAREEQAETPMQVCPQEGPEGDDGG